jgi:hypothetical protein
MSAQEKIGKGNPPLKSRFTSSNQPSRESKRQGQLKGHRGAELVRALLDVRPSKLGTSKHRVLCRQAAAFFGMHEKDVTYEVMMFYKVAERVFKSGDVVAFNALMDRGYGKPLLRINEDWTPPETSQMILTNGRQITL